MTYATVAWGQGPAIVPLAASLIDAGICVREIWYQDPLCALPKTIHLDLASIADRIPLIGEMNSSARVLERLEKLPEVNTITEVFYTKIIGRQVLERTNVINIHPAPLPRYRGAHPLPWQIMRGETKSAVTFHLADSDLDGGPIISQVPFHIEESDNYSSVLAKVFAIIRAQAGRVFTGFVRGELSAVPQDHTDATYVVKRAPHDGWIVWSWSAPEIRNFVRALTAPLPGAWSLWNGQKVILDQVEIDPRFSKFVGRTPGQVASLGRTVAILTGDSAIVPSRIRESETGRDITGALHVNDRFSSPLAAL